MKKISLLIGLIMFCTALSAQSKTTTAIVEFDIKGNVTIKDAGTIVAEWMSSSALKTGKFELYERILLQKVLEEQKLGVTGVINQQTAAKMGELFGVEAIISGSIIEWRGIYSVSARLLDTSTGKVLSSADYKTKDLSTLASITDKMAMVLAGTLSQDTLDRENIAITQNNSIQVPYSIIKVFEKDGKLKAALNVGLNDNITANLAFHIYIPEYQTSDVTGQKTIVGKKKIGDLIITQIEPDISSGNLYIDAAYRNDPQLIAKEGIAVLGYGTWGLGIGATNSGVHLSMLARSHKSVVIGEISYLFPLFSYSNSFLITSGVLFKVIGSYFSPINLKLGGNYLAFLMETAGEGSSLDTALAIGLMPLAELGIYNIAYIRGGAFVGYDFMDDTGSGFLVFPIIQAGVSLYFEK